MLAKFHSLRSVKYVELRQVEHVEHTRFRHAGILKQRLKHVLDRAWHAEVHTCMRDMLAAIDEGVPELKERFRQAARG